MTQTHEPIALIDMDGTLCDYDGAMHRDMESLRDPEREPELPMDLWSLERHPHIRARMDLIKRETGWWRNLERIEGNFIIYELMRSMYFDLHILTKGPWRTTSAWSEKVDWCRENVPEASVHISEDKGLVYGKVLMDDYPAYIRRWLEWRPRGLVIMPAWPWNEQAFKDDPRVIRWDADADNHIAIYNEIETRLWAIRQTALYTDDNWPEIHKVSGTAPCDECGKSLHEHPFDFAALSDKRRLFIRIACDGRRIKI